MQIPSSAALIVFSCALLAASAILPINSTGQSSPASTKQAQPPRLAPVHLDGSYFTREGKRFLPVGAHWVPAKAAMQWPIQWTPEEIEADFAKMQELGYSMVRLDLLWAWFEPRPGDYNPVAFQQLDY